MGDKLLAALKALNPAGVRVTIRSAGGMSVMVFHKAEANGNTLTFLQNKGGQLVVNLLGASVDRTSITYPNGDQLEIVAM